MRAASAMMRGMSASGTPCAARNDSSPLPSPAYAAARALEASCATDGSAAAALSYRAADSSARPRRPIDSALFMRAVALRGSTSRALSKDSAASASLPMRARARPRLLCDHASRGPPTPSRADESGRAIRARQHPAASAWRPRPSSARTLLRSACASDASADRIASHFSRASACRPRRTRAVAALCSAVRSEGFPARIASQYSTASP